MNVFWKNKGLKELWLFYSYELILSLGVSKAKVLIKLRASFLLNNGSRDYIRQFGRHIAANKRVIEGGKMSVTGFLE